MLDILLEWCEDNGIWIDPRLDLRHDQTGIAVYSKDLDIPHLASLVHIPKSCVLSAKSCPILGDPTSLYGHEAQYALSLALYIEFLKGKSSRWFGYLQSLPEITVDLPVFWTSTSPAHPDDGQEGMLWLRGTEVDRRLERTLENSLEAIADYYNNVAEPALKRFLFNWNGMPNLHPDIQGFYRAYSLVSSRAFFVDAYHGLAMVPVADAFNHAQENHVHLQSEFSVCPHCGSLYECAHDRDGASVQPLDDGPIPLATRAIAQGDMDDFYEMVSNTPIPPHAQVFNTYGESLDNAQLLCQYGFTLDANEHDYLSWDPDEVFQCLSPRRDEKLDSGRTQLMSVWEKTLLDAMGNGLMERISESQLIYLPSETSTELCLNSDGKISYPLWILLALLSMDWINANTTSLLETLSGLMVYQLALENGAETDRTQILPAGNPLASAAAALARCVIVLCVGRKADIGKEGANHADLGGILDMLPENMPRTRQAISTVMSERSILDSCEYGWADVFNTMSISDDDEIHC